MPATGWNWPATHFGKAAARRRALRGALPLGVAEAARDALDARKLQRGGLILAAFRHAAHATTPAPGWCLPAGHATHVTFETRGARRCCCGTCRPRT